MTFALVAIVIMNCITGCNKRIQPDDPNTVGMGEGAKKVLEMVKNQMTEIKSFTIQANSTSNSEMYGFSKDYEGTLKVEFGGKPGTLGNLWYETEQTAKGRHNKLRGIRTADGITELYLIKKKVLKGGEQASGKARITGILFRPYGYEKFFDELEGKQIFEGYPGQKTNTYLKGVESYGGVDCYVIATYKVEWPDRKNYYYFGVDDLLFRGDYSTNETEDGLYEFTTTITDIQINQSMPEWEVEVPADYAVEMYVAPWEAKSMKVGDTAHDWTLENPNGEKITLSAEYAKNVVLLDFWATWCGPCKAKMPFIQKMHEKYGDKGLKVISVLSGDVGHEKQAAKYIADYKYTFDLVFGNNELSEKYNIRFLPTVMMVDDEGTIIHFRDTPGVNDNIDEKVELEDAIKKALNLS